MNFVFSLFKSSTVANEKSFQFILSKYFVGLMEKVAYCD